MIPLQMLSGLSKEGEVGLKESFLAALVFRKAATSFFSKKIDTIRKKTRSEKFILEGDFGQKMAWNMGYEKAVEDFASLLESDPQK